MSQLLAENDYVHAATIRCCGHTASASAAADAQPAEADAQPGEENAQLSEADA